MKTLDEAMALEEFNFGELGNVSSFLANQPMNDNVQSGEQLIARMLMHTGLIFEHINTGLPAMLKANGSSPQAQQVMEEFFQPVAALIGEIETSVMDYVRNKEATSALVADHVDPKRLQDYADQFARLADTPEQMKTAAEFRRFIQSREKPLENELRPEKER